MNRTGNNTTGWARRLTALLITACLVMAMALPVYAEVDLLPDVPDEVELLEDEPGTAPEKDTIEQLPDANAPPEQEADAEQDAATPEPEQSAGPEQPAPTETPEPTAEPTPTPEPAATATATPVPTVTPTATPEPTEQPQKMYAERSVGNVQAVSEQENTETHTLYFAVPSSWSDCTVVKIHAADGGNPKDDHFYFLEMQEVDKTKDGRKIYSVVLNKANHYKNGGLNGLEFRGYKGNADAIVDKDPAYKVVIAEVGKQNPPWMTFNPDDKNNYIGGDYYDGENGDGWDRNNWSTYTVGHKHFANQAMAFENKTSETLTNVKAWFYEPDEKTGELKQVDAPILLNSDESGSGIASGTTATFTIPDAFCSFVRFTAGNSDTEISEYYNFYNEKVTGVKQKSFQYSEGQCYCYMYNGIKDATWGRPGATRIYYDATFSKMALKGDTDDFSIPKANNSAATIYYRIKGDNETSESGTLAKDGTNENLYYIDIPQGYSSIIFSGDAINGDEETKGNGVSTAWLTIPTDGNNCFYADTNDAAVYNGATRDGYWAPKGTLRDAETWKEPKTKVVDIAAAEFTEKPNTKYVTSTLYDYYTDYELNGKNRDSYDNDNAVNQRHWVTFRQFDQAISDYYQSYVDKNTGKPIIYPIYTGHFQPSGWYMPFSAVAATLNLYGWAENYQIFIAANNSNFDTGNKENKNSYAFQGIVADKRDSDGDIVMNGTTLKEPHFNEEFLTSQNSKNAKLGEVYHNVEFPFTQKEVFVEAAQDGKQKGLGVKYWWFDSSKTSLYLRKDTKSDQLYLGNDSTGETTAEYLSEASHNVDSASASDPSKVSTQYGFFPFNENTTSKSAVRYNYGYGAKLEIPFTLTSTGTVKDDYNNEIPIRFYFSGDDDVWVFIDDQLVLDIGGAHAKVSGVLEFDQRDNKKDTVTSYVSRVKNNKTHVNGADYGADNWDESKYTTETTITYLGTPETYYKNASVSVPNLSTGKHTLTMYYMERGMWESNMAVAFNFPDHNELQVEKQVDANDVRGLLQPYFTNSTRQFTVGIKNWATHYAALNPTATTDAGGSSGIGFTTKQYTIKDYGSVAAGGLKEAVGAQYTTSEGESTNEVGADGKFTLQNGETVTFADQFRRGSYISLQEDLQKDADQKLYAPTWKIYENGKLVMESKDDDTVDLVANHPTKMQGDGTTPDDGRKEVYIKDTKDGQQINNDGYTKTEKPTENSIVFRSYSNPAGTDQFTKLKVKFINKVKTGSLSITKQVPEDEKTTFLGKTYTFTVQYTNIGGLGGDEIITETVEVPVGETVPLKGIPIGTTVTVTEDPKPGSYIKSVTVNDKPSADGDKACVNIVEDKKDADDNSKTIPGVRVVFTNTAHKPITIDVEKKWQDSKGGKLTTGLPESIWVKLERRHKGSTKDTDWTYVPDTEVKLTNGTWKHTFHGMDAYDISDNKNTYYEYRVVESAQGDGYTATGGMLKLGDYNYQVYSEPKTITNADDSASLTLTNTQVQPVYELAITKQGLDENGATTGPLSGVEFKLEKLSGNGVDATFKAVTGTTAGDGDAAGKCSFTKLSEGSYRLTELKTVDGYNLLAAPIEFTLQNGKCLINGTEQEKMVTGTPAEGYTVSLTINNRKGFTLPHTGADAPSLWLLIGLPLLVAGLLVLVFRYNRKGGKRS